MNENRNYLMSATITILVVEDVVIAQKIAKMILQDLGCQVDIARNGHEAIKMTEVRCYDLIFMDIGLPDINGIEVTEKIREKHGGKIPIIALTANSNSYYQASCLKAGMNDFIEKPLAKESVKAVIDRFKINM